MKLCWELGNSKEYWAKLLRSNVFRGRRAISHHIYSSIWSSVKAEIGVIVENCRWLIGLGENINFWLDSWHEVPMVSIFNIPAKVSDFIFDFKWRIPISMETAFPNLRQLAQQITLASDHREDMLLWKHCNFGALSLKEAFLHKNGYAQNLPWTKAIWGLDIPPSKSLLIWRLMHRKIPTDENLNARGCSFPSMCSTCKSYTESSMHLFFECSFAVRLWSWLASIISVQVSSIGDIWPVMNRNWSP